MDCHERDALFVVITAHVLVGGQRYFRHEMAQHHLVAPLLDHSVDILLDTLQQLLNVFLLGYALGSALMQEHGEESGGLNDVAGHVIGIVAAVVAFYKSVNESGKGRKFLFGAGVETAIIIVHMSYDLPHAHPLRPWPHV